MRKSKKAKLEAAGWVVGSVKEFLGLSEADAVLIEMKLALSRSLRDRRNKQGLSQVQLAERLQSSQSRVAKMEAGDPSVSNGPLGQFSITPWSQFRRSCQRH